MEKGVKIMKKHSRVKALVSLDAIAHNFSEMRKNIQKDTKIIAVLKADGYGHGAGAIAHLIEDYDYIWGFAAATAQEALSLVSDGVTKPVLILGHVFEEDYAELAAADVRIAVSEAASAKGYAAAGKSLGKTVHIHLALDTGMSRIGFSDSQESLDEIAALEKIPNLKIEGIFTHFARADEEDIKPAVEQFEKFMSFTEHLKKMGVHIPMRHCSNSAGIIRFPQANLNAVRAGITIYGIYPSKEVERDVIRLLPAMELKSRVSFVKTLPKGRAISYGGTFVTEKDTVVATIPVGYADGYPRSLSNKGWVLIHGKKAPILGRVCMDQFMVDATGIPGVRTGDSVTLMGKDGEEFLSVEELGDLSGRFSYEFICDISRRVPRVYIKNNEECGEF